EGCPDGRSFELYERRMVDAPRSGERGPAAEGLDETRGGLGDLGLGPQLLVRHRLETRQVLLPDANRRRAHRAAVDVAAVHNASVLDVDPAVEPVREAELVIVCVLLQ